MITITSEIVGYMHINAALCRMLRKYFLLCVCAHSGKLLPCPGLWDREMSVCNDRQGFIGGTGLRVGLETDFPKPWKR